MWCHDAEFYKRNAVLKEHPWYLVPGKWMKRALEDQLLPFDEDDVGPRILHSCAGMRYNTTGNTGEFLKEDFSHNYKCKHCMMRPTEKMITLYHLLK
jgi:hypothetical protein